MEMGELQQDFEGDKDFRIVATSVDPDRDTLERLDKHGKNYDADPERWYFLRGEKEPVKKFAHEGLKIAWHPDDPLIHSNYFVLIDRLGRIRGYYQQSDLDRMETLRVHIRALLAEKTP
jgi:protein SCO1/2